MDSIFLLLINKIYIFYIYSSPLCVMSKLVKISKSCIKIKGRTEETHKGGNTFDDLVHILSAGSGHILTWTYFYTFKIKLKYVLLNE